MRTSHCLLQTVLKPQGPSSSLGVSKIRPSFNLSSNKEGIKHAYNNFLSHRRRNMASATTFFDFNTKDSKRLPSFTSPPSFDFTYRSRLLKQTFPTPGAGKPYPLSQHRGKVVLVVNTASKCGFTRQLKGLERLYTALSTTYPDQFDILAFPCNQFAGQEPDDGGVVQTTCLRNYGVTFPVLARTNVNPLDSGKAEPVWEWMKKEKTFWGFETIKWNFEKFLIGRDGKVVERWTSFAEAESLEKAIVAEIKKGMASGSES
jgi:peroxiredoxin